MATVLLCFSPTATATPSTSTSFLHKNPNLRTLPQVSISFPRTRRAASVCRPLCASAAPAELLDISKLGISEQIVSALSRRGITELFPIQRAVLEPAMEGRDMIGRAITGSGKTLAFGIPILDNIIRHQSQQRKKRVPSALILAPTRELARQVQREFEEAAPNLSSTCLYGGIPITNQTRVLGFGIDIAVGTPGRIIDLVERGALNLSEVRFVVLDEADQMLAVGFQEDVECILNYLPAKKQCMLFSATMPFWVKELSRKYLKNPLVVDLVGGSDQKLAEGISLFSIASTALGKQNLLSSLISQYSHGGKTIIFTRTRKDAEELSRSMGRIIGSKALHGNMHQTQRDKTIAAFSGGRFNVLVATDVAARGLDIPDVDLVIHFEMPNTSEIFVHRSGRTGRAGKKGTTVLMFTEGQRRDVRLIERDLCCKFEELPRNVDAGNRNEFVGGRGSSDEGHVGSVRQRDNSYSDRFGNYGSSRGNYENGNTRKLHSNASKFSKGGRYGGHQSIRKNGFSSISGSGRIHFSKPRGSQLVDCDGFVDSDGNNRKGNSSRTPDTNYSQSPSRPRYSKFQSMSRSKTADSIFGDDSSYSKRKRPSDFNSDSFEQILDLFKDH